MGLRRFISLLVAVFVSTGLAVAPLVTPALAKPMVAAASTSDMAAMSDDMPCCPDKQKSNDCPDCPLAICTFKISQAGPSVSVFPIRLPTRVEPFVFDEQIAPGLDRPPPDHPPRNLVRSA